MELSRRRFFQTSAVATAVALAAPHELLGATFAEPQRVARPGGMILLNSNENPYGAWPSLMAAMTEDLNVANRYPDSQYDRLVQRVAALHRVKEEQVIMGCGSGEILRICAECFTGPRAALVTASPTFEALGHHTRIREHEVRTVRLNSRFEHDLEQMADTSKGPIGLVYICNPNNPTASITPRKAIEAILPRLSKDTIVLIDEAYHHFALSSPDYVSFLDQPVADDRIIVARTFSKIYGLAGMRVGYAIAALPVAHKMAPFALPDGVNVIAAQVAVSALDDAKGLAFAIKRNEADRDEFLRQVKQRNIQSIPSQGNFVMIDTGKPIREVIGYFRKHNIAIGRPFPPYDTHARISLGKPEEMKTLWTAWDQMKTS